MSASRTDARCANLDGGVCVCVLRCPACAEITSSINIIPPTPRFVPPRVALAGGAGEAHRSPHRTRTLPHELGNSATQHTHRCSSGPHTPQTAHLLSSRYGPERTATRPVFSGYPFPFPTDTKHQNPRGPHRAGHTPTRPHHHHPSSPPSAMNHGVTTAVWRSAANSRLAARRPRPWNTLTTRTRPSWGERGL